MCSDVSQRVTAYVGVLFSRAQTVSHSTLTEKFIRFVLQQHTAFHFYIFEIMSSGNTDNVNLNTGTQLANLSNSTLQNSTLIINQPDHQIDISEILAKYKQWVREEKKHSLVRKKLNQLVINGEDCHIKRSLKANDGEFPEDELLNQIPHGVTSLVTGPAGSGKSTLAASTMINWAESEESRYDLVLYFSSLHEIDDIPLHKQLWGEYSSDIGNKDTSKIYDKLIDIKDKILVIIDGLGNNKH